jgi:hypothetical protein
MEKFLQSIDKQIKTLIYLIDLLQEAVIVIKHSIEVAVLHLIVVAEHVLQVVHLAEVQEEVLAVAVQ